MQEGGGAQRRGTGRWMGVVMVSGDGEEGRRPMGAVAVNQSRFGGGRAACGRKQSSAFHVQP
jgi:hypothetical protein